MTVTWAFCKVSSAPPMHHPQSFFFWTNILTCSVSLMYPQPFFPLHYYTPNFYMPWLNFLSCLFICSYLPMTHTACAHPLYSRMTSIVFNKNPFIQLHFQFRLESPQVSDTGTRKARSPTSLDYFSNITATSAGLHHYYTLKILIRTRILVR